MSVDIDIAVEKSADGKWIRERVPARVPDSETFELANSPMIVRGLAADDHIRLADDGQFELITWGRNVAIQVFGEWGEVDALAQHVAALGGRLDGKEPRMRVFTVPLSVGIHTIEETIDRVVADWPKLSWMFGNLTTIDLLAGHDETGEPVVESLHAFAHSDGTFELLVSPLLVSGVASGDHVALGTDATFEVTARNGNLAVQTLGDWEIEFFAPKVVELGGRLDGDAGGQAAAFTFPGSIEIDSIRALFDGEAASNPDRTWRIANDEAA